MKIYIDSRTMASKPSGVGMYLYELLKTLIKYNDLEITLLVDVIESPEIIYFKQRKANIIDYGKKTYKSTSVIKYFKFIKNILRDDQPEMFWEPNNIIPIKFKGYEGNIILTIHDLFPITIPRYSSILYQIYFRIGIKKGIVQANKILYDSQETKSIMRKYFSEIMDKENFVSYIPIPRLKQEKTEDLQYFLYIGNLEKRKGVDLLLKAFAAYRVDGGKKKLYLAGKMRDSEIKLLVEETQKKTGAIKYYGYVSSEEKIKLLSRCSCFVFPSKAEGFGIPPIEAMNYEKPMILSDLSIFKEIIGECVNYFSLDVGVNEQIEKLKYMLENYRESDRENYEVVIQKYNPNTIGEELYKFINQ